MAKSLQAIVDSLGRRLSRPVALDDHRMDLLAYNSHFGRVDEVRATSILHRRASSRVIGWVNNQGIRTAVGPVRIPANPQLGMTSRVCAPVRFQGKLLGFLWLIEDDQCLTDQDLEEVQAAADAAAEALQLAKVLDELQHARERELLRDLLSHQADVRRHAAEELVEGNLIVPTDAAVSIVVRLRSVDHPITNIDRLTIRGALDQVRHSLSPRHTLHLVRPDHGLLVCALEDPVLRVGGTQGLAQRLLEAVQANLRASHHEVLIGVGDVQSELSDIAQSYEQACLATRVAEIVSSFAPIATWSELGVYRVLLQFPIDQGQASVLYAPLLTLINEVSSSELLVTLEAYLDLAGSAKRTASKLRLHRATLYYRLRKVEEITGVDLEDGNDRLALHLSLKLARLAGILPQAEHANGRPTGRRSSPAQEPAAVTRLTRPSRSVRSQWGAALQNQSDPSRIPQHANVDRRVVLEN